MKIVCIDNALHSADDLCLSVRSDSSVLRNNDAFYMPSFSQDMRYTVGYMLRITRLAKWVNKGFASRCYEAVGVAVAFTAHDIVKRNCAIGRPCDEAYCFDKSIAVSTDSVEKSNFGEGFCKTEREGSPISVFALNDLKISLDEAVARASELLTLKTGDIVYVAATEPAQIAIGEGISVSFGETNMLDFQVR